MNGDQIMIKSDINCLTCKQERVQLNRQLTIVVKINKNSKEDDACIPEFNIFKDQEDPDLFALQRNNQMNNQSQQTLQISNCVNCGNYIVVKQQELQRNSRTIYDCVDFGHLNKEQQQNSHLFSQAIKEHPKFSFRPDVNPLSVMSVLKKYQKIKDNQLSTNQLLIMQSLAPNSKGIAKFDYNPNSKYLKHRRKTIKALFQVSERFGFNNETIHHSIQLFDAIFMQKCTSKEQKNDDSQYLDPIESLRENYESCKGVISEQICTFIASVCLFISSKYLELKYPVVEDICELMQCPFTFDEFVEMEQAICSMFEWDLQIPTCIESLQSFFAQGVIFSTDFIGGKQQIGNQMSTKLVENLSQICHATATHIEELLQKMKQICLTLLPNLLIYDAQLFMSEDLVSPVHLALAIIIEGRRCLGIRPLFAEEFKWMAFGDLYKKATRYENSNYCKIGLELIEKEVQKVQQIVQKVQISLYQKNFEQEQQNKEAQDKLQQNIESNKQKDNNDKQNIQFHPSQNDALLSPLQNENLQVLATNQNEEEKNQHQIPKKLLSDILNQRKQEDNQRQWSDPNQVPKKQNEIHTSKSLHSTEPTTEAEKKLQNKNNFKEQQLKLHHLESLNKIERIEEKVSEIEESNVEHNYPDEFKEGNQTVRPTCSNNDPLTYNNQQNIIRTQVQEELRKQDIKPSFMKENQIKINLEALHKNSKLKIQPYRIQLQNNQNGLATVRNIVINKSAYESQKEGDKSKIQDNLNFQKDKQLNIMKKDINTKSLNTLGSSNYSYLNAYSDDQNNQQSFQNNIFQDLKSQKNNTFINVENVNENQKLLGDEGINNQKFTQLYNTVIDPSKQNSINYLQVPSQQSNENILQMQVKSSKNKSQQSISSKDASIQLRTKSNWSNPDNNDIAIPFKFSRQSQPQPISVKPQISKPRPSSNSINIQQQFNQIQVAIKSPKAKAKQSSSVTSIGGPIVSQKPPQCNLKIAKCKNILKTNLLPQNQPKIVLKGKKQINNRKESVGGSVSSRDSDMNVAAINSLKQILGGAGQGMYGIGNIQSYERLMTDVSNPGEMKQPSSYNMSTSTERASQQYLNENIGFIKNNQKQQLTNANFKGVKAITHRANEQTNVFQYQSNPKISQQKQQTLIIGRAQGPRASGNQTVRKGIQSSHAITAEQNSSVGRTVIGPKMQNEKMTEKKSNILKNNGAQIKKGEIDQYLSTDFKKNVENQHFKNLSKHSDWEMQALNHHYNSVQQDIVNGQKQYNSITDSKQNLLDSCSAAALNEKTHGIIKQNLNQIISQKIDKILDDNRSSCTAATAPNPISSSNINFISASLNSRNTDFKQPVTARGTSSNYYSQNQKQQNAANNSQHKGLPPKMQKCSTSIGIIPTNASSYSGMNQDKKESSNNMISSQKIQLNIAKKHQATNQLQPKLPLKIDFDDIGGSKLNRNSNIQTQMNKTSSKQILQLQIKSGFQLQQQKPPIINKLPQSSQPNGNALNNKQDYSQVYLLTAEDNVNSRNNNLISNVSSQGKQIFQTMQSFQQPAQILQHNSQRNQNHINDKLNIQSYLNFNSNGQQYNPEKVQNKESHSKLQLNLQMIKQDQLKKIQGCQTSRNYNGHSGMSLIDSWKQKANNQNELNMQGTISHQIVNQKTYDGKSECGSTNNMKNGVQNGMFSQLKLLQNIQQQQNRKLSVESQNGAKSQPNISQQPQKQVVKINGRQTKITPQFLLNR